MFNVTFNDGSTLECSAPVSGEELLRARGLENEPVPVVAWHVDHLLRPLNWVIDDDVQVDWIDLSTPEGMAVYQSSLSFLLCIAARRVLNRSLRVNNSISEGLFWVMEAASGDPIVAEGEEISEEGVAALKSEMQRMIDADLPFTTEITPVDKARRWFNAHGRPGKAALLACAMSEQPVELSVCDGEKDMFYAPLVARTGYLRTFDLSRLAPGLVLRFPTTQSPKALPAFRPSEKLQKVFLDYAEWMRKFRILTMVQVWDEVTRDGGRELILMSEAQHAQQIAHIAEDFLKVPTRRVITIAGPSASGKTTTSHKLRIQLMVHGRRPIAVSLDDYFVDREKCPLDENGKQDFEALETIDLALFDRQMAQLLAGETVRLPKFDFFNGKSMPGPELKLEPEDVLIVEGLHALNDRIFGAIPRESRYGIFLSPLTGINLDKHTRTSTTDHRLLRRMLRDARTRGYSPERTLLRWPSVVRGGMKWIFPYQHNADAMFNSSLLYELPVMRVYAEGLLRSIDENSPVRGEAMRLLRLLRSVPVIDPDTVPSNSLLREFIGGSLIEI